jgi:hypothetical protein
MRQGHVLGDWLVPSVPMTALWVAATLGALGLAYEGSIRSARGDEGKSAAASPASAASDSAPAEGEQPADTATIEVLVRQLGDPSYALRQQAAKRLIEAGVKARALLTSALNDDDAEIRSRARQVLSQINDADFRARLAAFENDLDGRQNHTLPCWDRFRRHFGDDKVARILFAEMQQSERELLESLDTDPRLASDVLVARLKAIIESFQFQALRDRNSATIDTGTICALLMVSGDDDVTIPDFEANQLYTLFKQAFQHSLNSSARSIIIKKMLGAWIVHNSTPSLAKLNLGLAFDLELHEGLTLALKLLAGGGAGQQGGVKQDALLAVGVFGNHEQIAVVEPFLKDASPCLPQQAADANQSQVRDVALAVLIHLSGQELKDYGLDHIQSNPKMLFQPGTITFTDPAARTEALKKWDRWAASNDGHEDDKTTDKDSTDKNGTEKKEAGKPAAPEGGKDDAKPTPAGAVPPRPAQSDQ